MVELPDEKTPDRASDLENQQILEKEGNRILAKVGDREYVIALAIEGQQFPSEKFSQTLEEVTVRGYSEITFVIAVDAKFASVAFHVVNPLSAFLAACPASSTESPAPSAFLSTSSSVSAVSFADFETFSMLFTASA